MYVHVPRSSPPLSANEYVKDVLCAVTVTPWTPRRHARILNEAIQVCDDHDIVDNERAIFLDDAIVSLLKLLFETLLVTYRNPVTHSPIDR